MTIQNAARHNYSIIHNCFIVSYNCTLFILKYNIYFLYDSGEKKYYEKGINVSDAFFHLYYDAFLFKRGIKHIEEYQILFDDKIENIYDYLI